LLTTEAQRAQRNNIYDINVSEPASEHSRKTLSVYGELLIRTAPIRPSLRDLADLSSCLTSLCVSTVRVLREKRLLPPVFAGYQQEAPNL
jgi:hypothetical protein